MKRKESRQKEEKEKKKEQKEHLDYSSSHLAAGNLGYMETIYGDYINQPDRLQKSWQSYFSRLAREREVPYPQVAKDIRALLRNGSQSNGLAETVRPTLANHQEKVNALINAYRTYGHKKARINPLEYRSINDGKDLGLARYGLNDGDLSSVYDISKTYFGSANLALSELINRLENTYCASIGAEFMYLSEPAKKIWFQERIERVEGKYRLTKERKLRILERLVAAEGLEHSLATKYPGTKRFGLEGGEGLIPMMDALVQASGLTGVREVVIGMAHRGRLNMLVNILGKNPASLFEEFEGKFRFDDENFGGDVKYHQGFSSNVRTDGGEVHLALSFNPSHLEIVGPVVEGSVRARQDRRGDRAGIEVLPVVIHGDASFAGQGVVMETLQMSQLRGYKTGGTVHIIINNQIGFTVSKTGDARSTLYATDVAKIIEAPILHINGNDPEALVYATELALEYRMKFNSDIVIDMVCYRKHGHNEADEPSITQPIMYQKIGEMPSSCDIYGAKLVDEGVITMDGFTEMKEGYRDHLYKGDHVSRSWVEKPNTKLYVDWAPYLGHKWKNFYRTGVDEKRLAEIGKCLEVVPPGFTLHRQVLKVLEDRREMRLGNKLVDWGYAELLAYGSLTYEKFMVRMTGQDSRRGTFSHRHAVVHDQKTGEGYYHIKNFFTNQPLVQIFDSFLSEEAVLAFEYGYATTSPTALVVWEAQFGDFANGAQVVIDQFLSSGETKWSRLCGLVLFLPHGYEGQGPEHSSARLERFLQLCAGNNMQVCIPSTAAQVFHMLRRQVVRPLRKPLVVMMPKSLLRKKEASSSLARLTHGGFKPVLGEISHRIKPIEIKRVILCSGKLFYELYQKRKDESLWDTAIIRLEQLYPFPQSELITRLKKYPRLEKLVWCQEEPMNQGAWYSSKHHLEIATRNCSANVNLFFAGRPPSAAPATGYLALHQKEQLQLLDMAFSR